MFEWVIGDIFFVLRISSTKINVQPWYCNSSVTHETTATAGTAIPVLETNIQPPHPWDAHYQFSIKTLLSKAKRTGPVKVKSVSKRVSA